MTTSSPPERLLTVADLDSRGEWLVVDVGPALERAYREVTGWTGEEAPDGLASVVARRAYTRGLAMPPGGVLREIRQSRLGPPPSDVATAGGQPVAQVEFTLDWPAGAA